MKEMKRTFKAHVGARDYEVEVSVVVKFDRINGKSSQTVLVTEERDTVLDELHDRMQNCLTNLPYGPAYRKYVTFG